MSGWFSTQRSIFTHPIFEKNPDRLYAWLWLISKAAYKDTKHIVNGKVHTVPRGSLFKTLRELASEWGWKSDTKVRDFLSLLESDGMIERKTNAGKTQITICNYSLYQNVERTENAIETQEKRKKNALKEQINQSNKIYTTLPDAGAMCAALGINEETKTPGLLSLSDPIHWLSSGCDMEMDILPTLRQMATRGKKITSWAYCSKAVFEARDKRLAPSPKIQQINHQPNAKPSVASIAMRNAVNG